MSNRLIAFVALAVAAGGVWGYMASLHGVPAGWRFLCGTVFGAAAVTVYFLTRDDIRGEL